jgi:hypothetical protein
MLAALPGLGSPQALQRASADGQILNGGQKAASGFLRLSADPPNEARICHARFDDKLQTRRFSVSAGITRLTFGAVQALRLHEPLSITTAVGV